jgi:hypothetical protein
MLSSVAAGELLKLTSWRLGFQPVLGETFASDDANFFDEVVVQI